MSAPIISALGKVVSPSQLITDEAIKERYYHIWTMDLALSALAVILPKTTAELSQIMRICHDFNQKVVIHGGLTNLVGATKSGSTDIVISLEKMNQIEEIDAASRTMTVQAGVILEHIQNAAAAQDLLFPLNFGAKGSAQIGGVIATNAGGLRVLRYGMTRNLVLGLEVVLADGRVISSMKKIIKDNSGYDLKQLFVGAEGTLGIITRAVLKLSEAPKSRNSAFVGFNDYEKVVEFLKYADAGLAGTLSGYELIWKNTYQAMSSPPALVGPPLPYDYEYYVLFESMGSHQQKDHEVMEELLASAMEKEIIQDAVMAHSEADMNWFWGMREDVGIFATHCENSQHYDISLPIPSIGTVIAAITDGLLNISAVKKVFAFGHVADGNIHLIIGKNEQSDALIHQVNEVVYSPLLALGGSVSAEHGIGIDKKRYLSLSRNMDEIALMKSLKILLDPKGILNHGRIIDVA